MTAFLENLYRLKAQEKYRTPIKLIVDEADAIAPQKPQQNEARMLGAIEDIVRRGGQRGIGCTLVTQRSAVLNKNVLTQAQILVVLRTIAPQDIAAIKAWIDVHGTLEEGKELISSLPSLPIGDAWFWSPGWPTEEGIFKRVHVSPIETFDSGATPKPGEKRIEPKNMADVDLDALKNQMAETIERQKADDPKFLKKRITELEKQVKSNIGSVKPNTKEIEDAVRIALSKQEKEFQSKLDERNSLIEKLDDLFTKGRQIIGEDLLNRSSVGSVMLIKPPTSVVVSKHAEKAAREVLGIDEDTKLGAGERTVLIAIAQHEDGMTREHITVQTGYKRSTRDAYIQRLNQKGFVSVGNKIQATQEGIDALGSDYEPLPTGDELVQHHLNKLPEGEAKILRVLVEAHSQNVDGVMSRDDITEITGYMRSTRDAYIQRLSARQLVVCKGRGEVKVSEHLV
jgi:DNA-binding MarR family transcriptional regulator